MHQHERGTDYFNCGAWVDAQLTYITVGEEGVQIHEYIERPGDLHRGEERGDFEAGDFAGEAELLADGEYEGVGR
jgi:hypothetical protein